MNIAEGFLIESKSIVRVLNESTQIAANSVNIKTIKSRLSVINNCLDRLIEIENMGYKYIDKSPEELKAQMPGLINKRLIELAKNEFDKILNKKGLFLSNHDGIKEITKAINKLNEIREELLENDIEYQPFVDNIVQNIVLLRSEVIECQIMQLLEKVEKELLTQDNKKAEKYFKEAEYLIFKNPSRSEKIQSFYREIKKKMR